MSNPIRTLTARSGMVHVSHPDRPDYFLCGAGGKHGAPVTINAGESTDEEFAKARGGCLRCKRGLDKMNMDAIVKLVNAGPVADKPAETAPAVKPVAPILGTATVVAHPVTLHARVEVLRRTGLHYEVRVISGVGGWSTPGKTFFALAGVVKFDDVPEVAPIESTKPKPTPITEPMDAEDYMALLVERQEAWMRAHPEIRLPALYEWFVLPGEEALVRLPEHTPAEKPVRAPRVYKSADELRKKRAKLVDRMARVAGDGDVPDRAAANLSPNARSRTASRAGRRRFERMDRNLATYAGLQRQLAALDGRIAAAEARERD